MAVLESAGPAAIVELRMRAHIAEIGIAQQRCERVAVRAVIEIALHGNVFGAFFFEAFVDGAHGFRLQPTPRVGRFFDAITAAFKMVDQDPDRVARWRPDAELGAIAAEHVATRRANIVHMAACPTDLVTGLGHQPHIDAARIIAIDQHRFGIGCAVHGWQKFLRKLKQRGAALAFDDADDIRIDVAHDLRGVAG